MLPLALTTVVIPRNSMNFRITWQPVELLLAWEMKLRMLSKAPPAIWMLSEIFTLSNILWRGKLNLKSCMRILNIRMYTGHDMNANKIANDPEDFLVQLYAMKVTLYEFKLMLTVAFLEFILNLISWSYRQNRLSSSSVTMKWLFLPTDTQGKGVWMQEVS